MSLRMILGLGVSAISLGVSTQAFAQGTVDCSTLATEDERAQCEADQLAAEQGGDAGTIEGAEGTEIVVTGSRIPKEFGTPDPITIINPEIGLKQGQSQTADLINSSPIAAGSVQITSVISTNFVTNGGADTQTVSLRGLGAERTLVLLNGRRAGPAGVRGTVSSFDLNVIPSSTLRSVEILKTGASSIYGSDAVAGVVNLLTKKSTDGLEFRGFASVPVAGAAETYNASLAYGKEFDRGHFLISADYFKRNNLQRNDRSFLNCTEEYLFREADGSRADIVDPRTGQPYCDGVIGNLILTNNDFTGPGFSPGLIAPNGQQIFLGQYALGAELNGVGIPLNGYRPGVVAPANFFGLNFDGPSTGAINQYFPEEQNSDVLSDLERFTVFADASYKVTDGIELYGEFLFNKRKTYTNGVSQVSVFQFTGNSDLPFFFCAPTDFNCSDADAGDPFNNEFEGNFLLRPLVIRKADSGTDVNYYRGVIGARGDFGGGLSGWNWDIYGQYSHSDGKYFQEATLADSIFTQDFRTRSCAGLVTPVTGKPCIDIDWTDPRVLRGDFNAAEEAFLFTRDEGRTKFDQLSAEAIVTGNLFRLPAGNVGTAIGATIRKDKINDVPGEASQAGNLFNIASAGITAGSTITKEVFGELQVPLIYDTPLIQRLVLSGAARYTDVSAKRRDGVRDSFSDTTWKAGFDWTVNDWLRFRGSIGTSFRAPALFELFLENSIGFREQQDIDICINTAQNLALGNITQRVADNCTAAGIPGNFAGATGGVTVTSGGGIGSLEPETSLAKTIGGVFTPRGWFWKGGRFSLAVDYFDINVKDEITTLGAGNIVVGCYNSEFFPDEPLCDNIVRAPAGSAEALNITDIRDTYININRQKNTGIDVTVQYVQDLGSWGNFSFLGQMTWQLKDELTLFEGTEVELNGTVGDPRWVGDFNFTWAKGDTSIVYGLDVVGRADNLDDLLDDQPEQCRTSVFRPGGRFCSVVAVPTAFYHSISLTQDVGDKFSLTLGVANLADRKPPRVSTVFNGGINVIGQAPVFGSQYDYLGRRVFISVKGKI